MSGRGGHFRVRGVRGRIDGRGSIFCDIDSGNYTATLNKNKGLCSALGNSIFNYGQKGAADQMRASWEKIVQHVGSIYGHDIIN